MKGAVIAIISAVVLILGIVVAVTYLFGRGGQGKLPGNAKLRDNDLGVFVSRDGGNSWQAEAKFGRASISGIEITDIVFHPGDPRRLYLGTVGNGLLTSATSSEDWSRVSDEKNVLPAALTVYQIAIDREGHLYIAGSAGDTGTVYRSDDDGKSFKKVHQVAQPKSGVYALAMDPRSPAVIYIGTSEGGVLSSNDRGESWSVSKWFGKPVRRLTINPHNPSVFYATFVVPQGDAFGRSLDGGRNWSESSATSQPGISAGTPFAVTPDPQNPNILYLATSQGAFRSTDSGKSWGELRLLSQGKSLPVFAIAVDPADSKKLYVATGPYLYKSTDGGEHWAIRQLPSTKTVRVLRISPTDPNVLWAGMRR